MLEDKLKVVEYLANNREHLMDKIQVAKHLKNSSLGTISHVFHDDVLSQYRGELKRIVVSEIAINTRVNTESILVVLEEIDIKDFLDG